MLTQRPAQKSIPTGHGSPLPSAPPPSGPGIPAGRHAPPMHSVPMGQELPHPPQCPWSLVMSTHRSAQRTCPAGHGVPPASVGAGVTQCPSPHTRPMGQVWPHAPQFPMLPRRSTQKAPHTVSPSGQRTSTPASAPATHMPIAHTRPVGHALPHRPQWDALTMVSTQNPSQRVVPSPHTPPSSDPAGSPMHAPLVQVCPVAHGRLQPPQCRVSERKLTQVPLQSI